MLMLAATLVVIFLSSVGTRTQNILQLAATCQAHNIQTTVPSMQKHETTVNYVNQSGEHITLFVSFTPMGRLAGRKRV